MKGVQRLNDAATCGCRNSGCSSDVFVNGKPVARIGVDSAGGRIVGPGADGVFANGYRISLDKDNVIPHGTGKHRSAQVSPRPSQDVVAYESAPKQVEDPFAPSVLVAIDGPLLIAQASFGASYVAGLCRRLAAFSRGMTSVPFTNFNVYDALMGAIGVDVRQVCGENATDEMRGNVAAILANLPFLAKAALASFERLIAIVATGVGASPEVALAIKQFQSLSIVARSFRGGMPGPVNPEGSFTNCGQCVVGDLTGVNAQKVSEITKIPQGPTTPVQMGQMLSRMGIKIDRPPQEFRGPRAIEQGYAEMLKNSGSTSDYVVMVGRLNHPEDELGHWIRMTRTKDGTYMPRDPQSGKVGPDVEIPDMTPHPDSYVVIIPVKPKPR